MIHDPACELLRSKLCTRCYCQERAEGYVVWVPAGGAAIVRFSEESGTAPNELGGAA